MTVRFLLSGEQDTLAASVPAAAQNLTTAGIPARALIRLREDPTAADPRAGAPPFPAVLEVDEPSAAASHAVSTLAGLDPAQSAVLAGPKMSLLERQPGTELILMLALRRPASMSLAACHDYWQHRHAPLAMSIPKLEGYAQHHADTTASTTVASAVGFRFDDIDGVAEIGFRNMAELSTVMADPDVAEKAFDDERHFVDHSRSALALFTITT